MSPVKSLEANKALVRRETKEVWNKQKLEVADEIYAPNYTRHDPTGEYDREGRKQFVVAQLAAFPDVHFTVEDQVAEGDRVVTRWTATGTHQGEFMDIPPSGVLGTTTGIDINRIADGVIVESWAHWDILGVLQQIGAIPAMGRENFGWGEPSSVTGDPGTPQANKALVEKVRDAFWNQKNPDVLNETHSPDFISHNPPIPGNPADFESYKQVALAYIAAFPDLNAVHDEVIAEGDKVVTRWTATGTHQGELMGIPPTGKKVTWKGITIVRYADGSSVEEWWAWDTLGLLRQIGAIPSPE